MKSIASLISQYLATGAIIASTSIATLLPARADGIFRPTAFKVTFYEIGLRNSVTGARNPIFQSNSGTQVDLSQPSTLTLISGSRPTNGTWDQAYALFSNSIILGGTDGNGCFIQSGATDTDNDGTFEIVTNNAALSGLATTTESSFGGSLGPGTPSVTSAVNGSAVTNLESYLVSSSNPTPGGGGSINRFLFIGTIGNPVTITDQSTGTVTYIIDTSRALETSGGCTRVSYSNTGFNISIE
jgi:hypothetical protein